MNIRPQVEELEDRSLPSVADLVAFQQHLLPSLEAQFNGFVSNVQSNLQTDLNHLEALTPSFPVPLQPLLNGFFAQEQQIVNAFPILANARFEQTVANIEKQLLAISPSAAASAAVLAPGLFYPFFPFFGYPGVAAYGYGYGYGGAAFTSGFASGTSGFSSGSVGSASPAVAGRAGQGMGIGMNSLVGSLTLPQSNHP